MARHETTQTRGFLVQAALAALQECGTDWMLLRGAAELSATSGDIDLLVRPDRLRAVISRLEAAGFLEVRAAGHGSHRFLSGWDVAGRHWVRLDIVTELRFGDLPPWPQEVTRALLSRALRRDGVRVPHPSDAFWLLFLHCSLDKRAADLPEADRIRDERWLELVGAAEHADGTGPAAIRARHLLHLPVTAVLAAARWEGRFEIGDALARVDATNRPVCRASSPRSWVLWARSTAARIGRRAGGRLPGRGRVVAFLGPDGSGKSTTVAALAEQVPLPTSRVYFGLPRPVGATRVGRTVRRLPLGLFVIQVAETLARAVRIHVERAAGRIVLVDRHPWDSLTAGDRHHLTGREALKRAVIRGLAPQPDLFVVLDAPAATMFARKGEHTVSALAAARSAYLDLARRDPRGRVLDTERPPADVRGDVQQLLWDSLTGSATQGWAR